MAFASTERPREGEQGNLPLLSLKRASQRVCAVQERKQARSARQSETAECRVRRLLRSGGEPLGEVGQGFVNAIADPDGGRISIAALAVGIAQGAFESARTLRRVNGQQFGKPISRISGNPIQARRHGHANCRRENARVPSGVARGPLHHRWGCTVHTRIEHGQALRQRSRRACSQRSGADIRGLRVREGLPWRKNIIAM